MHNICNKFTRPISQGSTATYLVCDEKYYMYFDRYFMRLISSSKTL